MCRQLFFALVRPLLELDLFLRGSIHALDKLSFEFNQHFFTIHTIIGPIEYRLICSIIPNIPFWARMFILSMTFWHKFVYKSGLRKLKCRSYYCNYDSEQNDTACFNHLTDRQKPLI